MVCIPIKVFEPVVAKEPVLASKLFNLLTFEAVIVSIEFNLATFEAVMVSIEFNLPMFEAVMVSIEFNLPLAEAVKVFVVPTLEVNACNVEIFASVDAVYAVNSDAVATPNPLTTTEPVTCKL